MKGMWFQALHLLPKRKEENMIWFIAAITFIAYQIRNHGPVQGLYYISFPKLQRMKKQWGKAGESSRSAEPRKF